MSYAELLYLRATGELPEMECAKQLRRLIEPIKFGGMTILDVGCAWGHYYRSLQDLDYSGVDLNPTCVSGAKHLFGDKFKVGDIYNLPLDANQFDVVFSYNLLAHLRNYETPIGELVRVSKKYVFIRALFDEEYSSIKVGEDINTWPIGAVSEYLKTLNVDFEFLADDIVITNEIINKQVEATGMKKEDFTQPGSVFKGVEFKYKILKIIKRKIREE